MGRIRVWQDGIAYALSHPLTGAGFNGWIWVTKRDWHSAYVEALAEHGFVGFILWFALVFGTMLSLTRLPRMTRHIPEMKWVANYCYMLRASLVAYAVGAMFLGITYWDLLYHLIFIAVLVRKFALEELAQYECRVASPASQPPLAPGALNPSAGRVASMRRADGGS
jgi:O-antigen ligase